MTPELSRPVAVDRIPRGGLGQLVEADSAECAALASRLAIPALAALACRFRLKLEPGGIRAEGVLAARLTRICVVSLDPFETEIAEAFTVRFVPAGTEANTDPDAVDEIAYSAGRIDLGEAAAEQLALTLGPYPRKPGATLATSADASGATGPLAGLAALRRRV